jgi:radical SAM protein with 4Fe4S-binding SPASM domain
MSKWKRKAKSLLTASDLGQSFKHGVQALKYDLDYARFYGKHSTGVASTTEINLEFCSACNLRCSFCALDHLKPKQHMSVEVLNAVMDTLLTDKRFKRVKTINLHNGGETLLHPKRLELITRLSAYKMLFALRQKPFPKIILLTNGMLLRPSLAEQLLELQVLDEVGFSLDGGSPEAFEALRVNAKWKKFADNVSAFVEAKKRLSPKLKTFGISIISKPYPLNNSWMEADFKHITEMLDSVEYRRLHDWGGQVDIGTKTAVNKKGCTMLMRQLVILPNGAVTVCCNDLNQKGVVGNVLESALYDVYSSLERKHYVEALKKGEKDRLDLCRDCVSF